MNRVVISAAAAIEVLFLLPDISDSAVCVFVLVINLFIYLDSSHSIDAADLKTRGRLVLDSD